jgi:histidine triad (HIT) family protein
MSLEGTYDGTNVFAKILRGDLPCVKVFEDDQCLAFMDIFPQTPGHCLVIPKTAARNFLDFPTADLGSYMAQVQTLTRAVNAAFKPDGIILTQFNGAPAGQTVFHLHFHIIPKYDVLPMQRHAQGKPADMDVLRDQAAQIAAHLT